MTPIWMAATKGSTSFLSIVQEPLWASKMMKNFQWDKLFWMALNNNGLGGVLVVLNAPGTLSKPARMRRRFTCGGRGGGLCTKFELDLVQIYTNHTKKCVQ